MLHLAIRWGLTIDKAKLITIASDEPAHRLDEVDPVRCGAVVDVQLKERVLSLVEVDHLEMIVPGRLGLLREPGVRGLKNHPLSICGEHRIAPEMNRRFELPRTGRARGRREKRSSNSECQREGGDRGEAAIHGRLLGFGEAGE